jgi:hypothetical protein
VKWHGFSLSTVSILRAWFQLFVMLYVWLCEHWTEGCYMCERKEILECLWFVSASIFKPIVTPIFVLLGSELRYNYSRHKCWTSKHELYAIDRLQCNLLLLLFKCKRSLSPDSPLAPLSKHLF